MINFNVGDLVIYHDISTNKYYIGKIKSTLEHGAFIWYSHEEVSIFTYYSHLHKIENSHCIMVNSLGLSTYDICRGCSYDCNARQRDKMINDCLKYGQGGVPDDN